MTQPQVFISHSDQDSNWCGKLVESLKQGALDVWYDRGGLHAGVELRKAIERELRARDIFLLVITPQSWASHWAQNECSLALVHHNQILGVIHQPTPNIDGFILIYQLLEAVGQTPEQAVRLVAEALSTATPEVDIVIPTGAEADAPVVVPGGIVDTTQLDHSPNGDSWADDCRTRARAYARGRTPACRGPKPPPHACSSVGPTVGAPESAERGRPFIPGTEVWGLLAALR
jgi:hypothetical protein